MKTISPIEPGTRPRRVSRGLVLAALVALAAASQVGPTAAQVEPAREAPRATPPTTPPTTSTPSPALPEAAVLEYRVRDAQRPDGEPYRLHRWRVPLDRARIEVVDVGMERPLSPWVRRGASLVVNGGFYSPEARAEGLVVAGGQQVSAFMARIGGGILTVARGLAMQHDAEAEPLGLPDGLDFAIQCRPRLVVAGRNNIARPTAQTAARTALCIRDGGRGLDVYVARRDPSRGRAGPTLHKLAQDLVDEGCEEALNLDGGPSTGVAWRGPRGVRALEPRRGVRHALVFTVPAP